MQINEQVKMTANYIVIIALALITASAPVECQRDLDDLRVTSLNRQDSGANYHTIAPPPSAPTRVSRPEVINQLGKPLLSLPPTQPQRRTTQKPVALVAPRRLAPAPAKPKLPVTSRNPPATPTSTSWIEPDLQPAEAQANAAKSCNWIPMREMQTISFDTGELIVRDDQDQPCYIISLRAFIRLNDNSYFPLRNFRLPSSGAYRIEQLSGGNGSSAPEAASRLVNCSLPAELVSPVQTGSPAYLFKEEVTLQLNCGHLVLQLQLDTAHQLSLTSIAFYQDVQKSEVVANLRPPTQQRGPSSLSNEHLVFATPPLINSSQALIVMPMYARYVCMNRILLTGNNSIQLVIDRLEFKRLAGAISSLPSSLKQHFRGHLASAAAVLRCPNPNTPSGYLTNLMLWRPDSSPRAISNKWTAGAATSGGVSDLTSTIYWCALLCLAAHLATFGRSHNSPV